MYSKKRYLITSALPYANGPLHVGHLAGAYIPADIYVRYLRLTGNDVKFICGSDEHGAAITMRAKSIDSTPREIVDKYHEINKDSFRNFGISFDIYHRTSSVLHHKVSQDFFLKLEKKGVFRTKVIEQYFDEEEQLFLADRYIKGQCPKCGYQDAYGDQCENCGSDLSPTDLIEPRSTISGNAPILRKTKHWFLPMQEYQEWVSGWIQDSQLNEPWKKHVLGQCESWIKQGLRERAMTRDLDWGVRVPLSEANGKVLYVWLDAPIGYISATQALSNEWEKYWKDEDTKLVHFIGKDNIVFHCIIFPILLHAHGEYILPSNIPANQFMNLENLKISTSRNHAVWLPGYLERFPGKQDELRYYLTVNMPENKDSDFNWKEFQTKVNGELVGVLGNFIYRTFSLVIENFDSHLKYPKSVNKDLLHFRNEVFLKIKDFQSEFDESVHGYEFKKATESYLSIARNGNKLLNDTAPWKLLKDDKDSAEFILCLTLEYILILVAYMEPILPFTFRRLKKSIGLSEEELQSIIDRSFDLSHVEIIEKIQLFEKIEDEVIQGELDLLNP